jgi:putative ABC transport system permease protein
MARAFRFNLNALGSLTLLVGMFLVANAVSISVLRRRPEIATLRSLGASRASIFAAFAVEGLAVGAAGTLLGEVGGLVLARTALSAVSGTVSSVYAPAAKISAAGFGAPVLAAAAAGALSSFLAVLLPAVEATRVPPAPAMRPGSTEQVRRRRLWPRAAGAALALVFAAVLSRAKPVAGFPWRSRSSRRSPVAPVRSRRGLSSRGSSGRPAGSRPRSSEGLSRATRSRLPRSRWRSE